MANTIGKTHPSYGTHHAWFLFSIMNSNDVARILIVEAKGPWAVQTIEMIVNEDQKVSKNCTLLAVGRDHRNIGIRSPLVCQVAYVDFMIDIVDHGRLLDNAAIATAFSRSLSDNERRYASQKLVKMEQTMERARKTQGSALLTRPKAPGAAQSPSFVLPSPHRVFDPDTSNGYQTLMETLMDLGFKKPRIKNVLQEMGSRVDEAPMGTLLKEALQKFQTAA